MGQPRMELQVIGEDSCHAAGSTEPAPQMLALRRLAGMELSLAGKPPGALLEYLTQLAVNTGGCSTGLSSGALVPTNPTR